MKKLKILIVDDEIDYCLIMKSYFHDKGCEVFTAYGLIEGLRLIETTQPDILFLDNNMPDGQGWKHVDEIVEKNAHLRIYLISAYRQKANFISESPNITVWEKPISLDFLSTVLE